MDVSTSTQQILRRLSSPWADLDHLRLVRQRGEQGVKEGRWVGRSCRVVYLRGAIERESDVCRIRHDHQCAGSVNVPHDGTRVPACGTLSAMQRYDPQDC